MAALTVTRIAENFQYEGAKCKLVTEYAAGSGAQDDTFTTTLAKPKKLLDITLIYSAAPTYSTNITADLDAALGAAYDVTALLTLNTADNIQVVTYYPGQTTAIETGALPLGVFELIFAANDQLIITVPDGGGSVTVTCRVRWIQMG
jgi:hypothetical protein